MMIHIMSEQACALRRPSNEHLRHAAGAGAVAERLCCQGVLMALLALQFQLPYIQCHDEACSECSAQGSGGLAYMNLCELKIKVCMKVLPSCFLG